jgi:probable blue pigment (indigoidine) exporter
VGLTGVLNPVTWVLLGTVVAGESLTTPQPGGMVLVGAGVFHGRPAAARFRDRTHCHGAKPAGNEGDPRTRQSSRTLAAFRP